MADPHGLAAATAAAAPRAEDTIICRVCERQYSKYVCPRCNTRFCSVRCYKEHNGRCTDAFQQAALANALHGTRASPEEQRRMAATLARLHASSQGAEPTESESEDEDVDDQPEAVLSQATLERLSRELGQGELLSSLGPDERRQFERAVAQGHLSHLVEPWTPWWCGAHVTGLMLRPDGTALVQEVLRQEASTAGCSELPAPPGPLPALSSLTRVPPSPLLRWHLLDVLLAYCATQRLYNGDWVEDAGGAAAALLDVSPVLMAAAAAATPAIDSGVSSVILPETAEAAIDGGLAAVRRFQKHAEHGRALAALLRCDLLAFLDAGRPAILLALADAERMMAAAALTVEGGAPMPRRRTRAEQPSLERARRKLFFLMVWVNEGGGSAVASCAEARMLLAGGEPE